MKKQRDAATAAEEPTAQEPTDEMHETGDTEAPPPMPSGSVNDYRGDLVDRLKERHLPKGTDAMKGGDLIKRRTVSFDIDGVECEEGMFVNDAGEYISFKVTLRALNSSQEIESIRGVRDGAAVPFLMCKRALYQLNERTLSDNEREFFWEALGMGGRQICMTAFQSLGAASEAALGKYLSTRSES